MSSAKAKKITSTLKRALPSTSSGQAGLLKRTRIARMNRVWHWSGRNLMPRSCLMEKVVRRVVREELEHAKSDLAEYCRSIGDALKDVAQRSCSIEKADQKLTEAVELANIHSPHLARAIAKSLAKNDARNLQLQFRNKLSLPLYTGQKLEGESGACINVALIDVDTRNVLTSGPESSIKLDVVVLEGDFNKDDEENWAREEFDKYMVKEREGKRPLLTGNLQVTLKGGVGELGQLIFTDNSSWNRSKSFRIGLKVAPGYCGNTRIREAKTDPFTVKEHRGEAYKKNYPPASDDEIWRLKSIAKNGPFCKRLNEAGIHKVEEFLQQLYMDSEKLRNILGMTEKQWKALLDHAKTCTPNRKLYVYNHNYENDHGVMFNSVGQVSGLAADGEYYAADIFSAQQKVHADKLVKKAYENWNDVRLFNAEASSSSMSEKISCSFPSEVLGDQQCFLPVHKNMPPPKLASHVGLKVPPRTTASMVDGISGITAAGLPRQAQSLNPQNATLNQNIDSFYQMEPSVDTNVQPFGQLRESLSSFPASASSTSNFLPLMRISSWYGIVYPVLWKIENKDWDFYTENMQN